MKSKVLILVSLIFLMSTGALFAEIGLGASFGYGYGHHGLSNVALNMDIDAIPGSVQNVSMGFGLNYFSVGVTDDWYLIDDTFAAPFGWYLGPGFYANVGVYASNFTTSFGARLPIGIDVTLFDDFFVIFAEIAPAVGLGFSSDLYFDWGFNSAIGFRFYF